MAGESAPLIKSSNIQSDALAAGVSRSYVVTAPFAGTVAGVTHTPAALITGADTNSRTVTVRSRGLAGASGVTIATLAYTAGVNAPAFDAKAVPLSGVALATVVAEGDVVEIASAAVGTGIADPGGEFSVLFARA